MAIRVLVWFSIFPFRAATRFPSLLAKHQPAFDALEQVLRDHCERFVTAQAGATLKPGVTRDLQPLPLGHAILVTSIKKPHTPDGRARVVFNAALPFPHWPLGGLVVWDGLWRYPNGAFEAMTEEDLNHIW